MNEAIKSSSYKPKQEIVMAHKVYQVLASNLNYYLRIAAAAPGSIDRLNAEEKLEKLVKEHMPSGSGFNNGTELDLAASKKNKLVFRTGYNFMDENGCYAGWSCYKIVVTPDLWYGINARITCTGYSVQPKHLQQIREWVSSEMYDCLLAEYTPVRTEVVRCTDV